MKNIRHTLIERWYAFEDARQMAVTDPRINLYASSGETGLLDKSGQPVEQQSIRNRKVRTLGCLIVGCAG
jgi:large subunit ribosomal protein L47